MKNVFWALGLLVAVASTPALAEDKAGWVLSPDQSRLSYGTIKNEYIGELNHFNSFAGTVSASGDVEVTIDLTSVETWIDIRNERMVKFVFDTLKPEAVLKTKIDMAELEKAEIGSLTSVEVSGMLEVVGESVDIDTMLTVVRLGEDRVMVSTRDMILVETDSLGYDAGIDHLQELAGLDGITRVVPVTFQLVFTQEGGMADASTAKTTVAKMKQ